MDNAILKRFNIEVKRAYYIATRYKAISTFALLHFEKKLSLEELSTFLRASDKFLLLDKNTYFIHFTFTSEKGAFKASENLILSLDNYFNNQKNYIALKEIDINITPTMLLNKLTEILKVTKEHSYSRIEDESILNSTF